MALVREAKRTATFLVTGAVLLATAASATEARYVVGGTGDERTVEDRATLLTWQQRSNSEVTDWAGALRHCEHLVWDGSDDWRLPDIIELSTIVDERRTTSPAINLVFFPGFDVTHGYWSSTTARTHAGSAYVLYFHDQDPTVGRGGVGIVNKTARMRALCVRDSSPDSP